MASLRFRRIRNFIDLSQSAPHDWLASQMSYQWREFAIRIYTHSARRVAGRDKEQAGWQTNMYRAGPRNS
jgi:hypothetical protein